MSELPTPIRQAVADRDGVEPVATEAAFEVTTTPFAARVDVAPGEPPAYEVTVRVPTLSAAVHGAVAPAVAEGWFETFQRRLGDAGMPLEGSLAAAPTATPDDGEVTVTARIEDGSPRRGVADAKAFVEYVEGTYMEGIVPGYDYRDPVASMRDRAIQQGDRESGAERQSGSGRE
jgi:hypothetical protein